MYLAVLQPFVIVFICSETRLRAADLVLTALSETFVQLINLSAMEVNMIRPFFTQALSAFYRLGERDVDPSTQDSQRQGAGRGPTPQQV
jgi:hypothetical protein